MKKLLEHFLLYSSGISPKIMIRSTPQEINSFKGYGIMVLIPALLGFISSGYAICFFTASKAFAFVFGLIWAFIIYNLDRVIIAHTDPGRYGIGFFSRLIIAIIISFTISEPLLIGIFHDSITAEITSQKDANEKSISKKYDKRFTSITSQIFEIENTYRKYYDMYLSELDGTGGSGILYSGPIAVAKKERLEKEQRIRDNALSILNTELSTLRNLEAEELKKSSKQIPSGFLAQMMILHDIAIKNEIAKIAVWFLRFLFLTFEIVPVLIKVNGKPKEVYDTISKMIDKEIITLSELKTNSNIQELNIQNNIQLKQLEIEGEYQINKLLIESAVKKCELLLEFSIQVENVQNEVCHYKSISKVLEQIKDQTLKEFVLNNPIIKLNLS